MYVVTYYSNHRKLIQTPWVQYGIVKVLITQSAIQQFNPMSSKPWASTLIKEAEL